MKPHKHAELIKAWADGAVIEACVGPDEWWVEEYPGWHPLVAYRIKPQPKPDVVHVWYVEPDSYPRFKDWGPYNLKLTFDGETGKLKSAEVING